MMTLRVWAALSSLVAVLAVGGCATSDAGAQVQPEATNPPTSPVTDPLPPGHEHDYAESPAPRPAPRWDDRSEQDALDVATEIVAAYAASDTDYDTWWAAVKPMMTTKAQIDYQYVDPANVLPAEVTGPARFTDQTSAYLATIDVPTTAGDYTVLLRRDDGQAPWLAVRVTPPDSPPVR